MLDDLVGRNVASLVDAPKGQQAGLPSKSLTLEQAVALMAPTKGTALEAGGVPLWCCLHDAVAGEPAPVPVLCLADVPYWPSSDPLR